MSKHKYHPDDFEFLGALALVWVFLMFVPAIFE